MACSDNLWEMSGLAVARAIQKAVTTTETRRAGAIRRKKPHDFRRSDAYKFFSCLEDAIETGPTGNNLRDFRVMIGGEK